jgi:hypothetical protein
MKRRSQPHQRKSKSGESSYAAKQGRPAIKGRDGKVTRGGRTRYAPTSPFSAAHVTDWGHRLARVALAALQTCLDKARGLSR